MRIRNNYIHFNMKIKISFVVDKKIKQLYCKEEIYLIDIFNKVKVIRNFIKDHVKSLKKELSYTKKI